jgi:hypothetical protein
MKGPTAEEARAMGATVFSLADARWRKEWNDQWSSEIRKPKRRPTLAEIMDGPSWSTASAA